MQTQSDNGDDAYRKKYRVMKRKLCLLVYEQEAFFEELKKAQRKLLKVSRDKSFLLDRIVQYERQSSSTTGTAESSSDSESTASSDSETKEASSKKRKVSSVYAANHHSGSSVSTTSATGITGRTADPSIAGFPTKKRPPASKIKTGGVGQKSSASSSLAVRWGDVVSSSLSHEEVERRLELKRINRPALMNIGVTPHSLPEDIFSHDNSNPLDAADGGDFSGGRNTNPRDGNMDPSVAVKLEDDDDANLIIDMAD